MGLSGSFHECSGQKTRELFAQLFPDVASPATAWLWEQLQQGYLPGG